MGTQAERLFQEAIKLPAQDRGDLTLRLLDTFDDDDEITDAELIVELDRRFNEGFEGSMTWDELRQLE